MGLTCPSFHPSVVHTTLTLAGINVYAPSCTRQLVTAYLAALKTKLPSEPVSGESSVCKAVWHSSASSSAEN